MIHDNTEFHIDIRINVYFVYKEFSISLNNFLIEIQSHRKNLRVQTKKKNPIES